MKGHGGASRIILYRTCFTFRTYPWLRDSPPVGVNWNWLSHWNYNHNSLESSSDRVIVHMRLEHQVGTQTHNSCKDGTSVETCSGRSPEHCTITLV